MSAVKKVGRTVGKAFKAAAPIIIPSMLTMGVGGFAGSMSGAIAGGSSAGTGLAGALMGPMGGAWGQGAAAAAAAGTLPSVSVGLGSSLFRSAVSSAVTSGSGDNVVGDIVRETAATPTAPGRKNFIEGVFDWMEENPAGTKLLGGVLSGAAQGYFEGERLEEERRQFDESRKWPGSFYGITRNQVLKPRKRREFF